MFTGIVQGLCTVAAVHTEPNLTRFRIDLAELASGVQLGASVAVNGTCLTVTNVEGAEVGFDVIAETLSLTNLGAVAVGDRVNVERSLKFGDEVGGHILSGHVSDRVRLARVEEAANERRLFFAVPHGWMKYLHHKGFVALDGASLTIASVDASNGEISVALIPETIARTTLGYRAVGDMVNLEVDAQTQSIVDTVERVLGSPDWQKRLQIGD